MDYSEIQRAAERLIVSKSVMPSKTVLHGLGDLPNNKWGAMIARKQKLIDYWKHLLEKARKSGHKNPHARALNEFKESVTGKSKEMLSDVALGFALDYGDTELVQRIKKLQPKKRTEILHESLKVLNSVGSIGGFITYVIEKFDKNIR